MSASVASIGSLESAPTSSAVASAVSSEAASRRLALLDSARVFAAMGIVWVHAATSSAGLLLKPLGTFGVPFYTFIALLFMARSLTRDNARTLGQYVGSRFFRIYLPFLFWSAIYVALGDAKAVAIHGSLPRVQWSILYAGGFEHLWFLPFLMVVTIAGAVMVRVTQKQPAVRLFAALTLATLGAFACFAPEPAWIGQRGDDQYFWHFGFRALPTVFWSIALALIAVRRGKLPRSAAAVAAAGGLLFVAVLLLEEKLTPLPILRSLSGLGCLLVALLPLTSPLLVTIGKLGRHSYGIYLSHVVFLRIIALVTEKLHTPASLKLDLASFAIAFIAASMLSVLLSRSAWTQWTVGE